jgi:hypothetical protein
MLQTVQDNIYETVTIAGASPGAGASFSSPIGDNSRRLLISLDVTLTTAAVAGNRLLFIAINRTGGINIFAAIAPTVQIISTVHQYQFQTHSPATTAGTVGTTTLFQRTGISPLLWLEPAEQFEIDVGAMNALDALTAINYTILRQLLPNT